MAGGRRAGASTPAPAVAIPRAPWALPVAAGVLLVAMGTVGLQTTATTLAVVLALVFSVYLVRHLAFAVGAARGVPTDLAAAHLDGPLPRVTVLVGCRDEERVVRPLVRSLLALDYPDELLQVIIIDDGSADRTGEMLDRLAAASGRLTVLHRRRDAGGGKSGALNEALELATGEIVVVFDADHQPARDVLRRLVRAFADPSVGAVQGRCRIGNGDDGLLARLIALDFEAGYLVNEYGRQYVAAAPAYGGANCAVRASVLRALGGWNPQTVTEDTDLTLRVALAGWRVRYDVTALDTEEAVTTLRRYWRQRYRWARGHQQVCREFRGAVLRSRRLSLGEKAEALAFLHAFHLPALSTLGVLLTLLWLAGVIRPADPLYGLVPWALLFLGPMVELGTGLLLARRPRRDVVLLVLFQPLFFVSMALCTKALFDGLLGRPYSWVKTERRGTARAVAA